MNDAPIEHVLLHRAPTEWRITVHQGAAGIACGALPDTPPDAPAHVARADLAEHLRRHWGFTNRLAWQETEPDWWSARPRPPATHP